MQWTAGALGAAAIASASAPARAQSAEDKAAAEALFNEGQKLLLAKKYAEACPKLEASHKLDPGIGTLLYIADCYEGQGRFASAYGVFSEARDQAKAAGQAERERIARGRAALLEPKLYKLTIVVAAPDTPGLVVKRGEAGVRREVWGLGIPVDRGEQTITASAPSKKTWTTTVKIPEGPGAQSVTIPALEDAPAAAPPPKPPEAPKPAEPPPKPPEPPPRDGSGQRIAGIAVGSAGLLGLVFAGAFTGLAAANKGACGTSTVCTSDNDFKRWQRAGTFADTATGLYIAGGALAATGVVLFLTAPRAPAAAKTGFVAPVVGAGFAGLTAGRSF
jgi:serine/threonine-protein kinase